MLQLTVDLSADKGTLLRVAQLILQFAGYEPPTVAPTPAPSLLNPLGHLAQHLYEGNDEAAVDPAQVFATQVPPSPMEHIEARLDSMFPPEPPASFPPPSPPAQATIPDLPPVPPPPPAAGIDVDTRGLPWDPRIHSGTRAKTVNGEWRQKRGTQPMEVARVEAELRQTMGASAPLTYVTPAPAVPALVMAGPNNEAIPAVLTAAGLVPAPPVPPAPFAGNAAPPAPPISSTPPVPASAGVAPTAFPGNPATVTFPQLMGAITRGFTGGTLKKDAIDAAIAKVGLPSLPMLASRQDLVGAVATELGVAL